MELKQRGVFELTLGEIWAVTLALSFKSNMLDCLTFVSDVMHPICLSGCTACAALANVTCHTPFNCAI